MKKTRILVIAMAVLMVFAAVSCKEPHVHSYGAPEVKDGEVVQVCECGDTIKVEKAVAVGTEEALKNAVKGDSKAIYLSDNVSLSEALTIDGGKKLTLNLNGKALINIAGTGIVVSGDKTELTIDGEGEVVAKGSAVQAIEEGTVVVNSGKYSGTFAVAAGKIFTDENNKITGTTNGHVVINDGEFNSTEFSVPVWAKSSAVINGGVFTATDNAVIGTNGSSELTTLPFEITVNGGTFNGKITSTGYIACGIYACNVGKVTLNGGVFNIVDGVGVLVRSGEIIAKAVEINLTEEKVELKKGGVGDSKVMVSKGAEIVLDKVSDYPGSKLENGVPKISVNDTGYEIKSVDGNPIN